MGQFYISQVGVQTIDIGFRPRIFIYFQGPYSYTSTPDVRMIYSEELSATTALISVPDGSAHLALRENTAPDNKNRLAFYDNGIVKVYSGNMNRYVTWLAIE